MREESRACNSLAQFDRVSVALKVSTAARQPADLTQDLEREPLPPTQHRVFVQASRTRTATTTAALGQARTQQAGNTCARMARDCDLEPSLTQIGAIHLDQARSQRAAFRLSLAVTLIFAHRVDVSGPCIGTGYFR